MLSQAPKMKNLRQEGQDIPIKFTIPDVSNIISYRVSSMNYAGKDEVNAPGLEGIKHKTGPAI